MVPGQKLVLPLLAGALVLVTAALVGRSAAAEPEWGTGLALGVAGVGHESAWEGTRFYGSLRGDALFFRNTSTAIGFGPVVEVGTLSFSDARFHGGAEVLLPFADFFAISAAPAAFVRSSSQGAVGGVSGRLFAGVRAYGYTEYSLSGGLLFGYDQDLGGPKQNAIVIGAQVDGLVLALPVLFVISALRGSHD